MTFRGLHPGWLALVMLAVCALLLFLYRQKPPARRVVVPSLALWLTLDGVPAGAPLLRSRARLLLSLLLALAIAGLLMLSLGDPTRERAGAARNLVLLIDCSASMAARDLSPTRLEQAKRRARALVQTLGEHDGAWVVALGDSARVLSARSEQQATLLSAIDRIEASTGNADLAAGVQLSLDLLAPYPRGELVLLSDGALGEAAPARRLLASARKVMARFERFGHAARNVAITQLAARPYLLDHAHREVRVQLHNHGAASEPLTLRLFAGDTPLLEERLELSAHSETSRVLAELPSADGVLRATLELRHGPDVLPTDDQAVLSLPAQEQTRVLLVSRGDRYLEAALLLDDTLDVTELAPEAYRSSTGFALVIFDGVLPAEPPQCAALYLGPPAQPGFFPLARQGELTRPYFERVEQAHPLVRELALGDVNIARAAALTLGPGDVAVASTAAHAPLIVEGRRDGQPFVVYGFDLRDSDLPLRAAFPLLFLRTLEHLRGPGESFRASSASAPDSAIEPRADVLGAPAAQPARAPAGRLGHVWPWLCVLALLLLFVELLSFHRGWTR